MGDFLYEARAAYDAGDYERALDLSGGRLGEFEQLPARRKASVHGLTAQALASLGRFDEAAHEREAELRRLVEANEEPAYVERVRIGYAWAAYKAGLFEKSLRAAGQAYLVRESLLGPADPETLSALHLCIYNLNRLGRYTQMLALTEELYARRVESLPEDAEEVADARRWLQIGREKAASLPSTAANVSSQGSRRPEAAPAAVSARRAYSVVEAVSEIVSGVARGATRGIVEGLVG